MDSTRVAHVAGLGGLRLDGDVELDGLDIGWVQPTTPLGAGRLSW